ncbi:IS3 family transposase [Actinoplanes sp. CA-252034]|uniref:IS3 family transposase n=1 Tax=Actinoplanes sp. CA-252034 TaxID=3239906 RepID=UPI003D992D46
MLRSHPPGFRRKVLDLLCAAACWTCRCPAITPGAAVHHQPRSLRHAGLTEQIRAVHAASRGTYGAGRVHAELRLGHGIIVGHKAVEMLMRRAGIKGLPTHRYGHQQPPARRHRDPLRPRRAIHLRGLHRTLPRLPGTDFPLGSPHAADIPLKFANTGADRPAGERATARHMSALWAGFARDGRPNAPQVPRWPAYTLTNRATMWIDTQCKIVSDPDRAERLFWENREPKRS